MNIPDLKPDRVYVVQVMSTNKFHEGEWSDRFEFETTGKGEEGAVPKETREMCTSPATKCCIG